MKYSVITPVYNREDCVSRCIESVKRQTLRGYYEHVIVDDGSNDLTAKICKGYAKNNADIQFVQLPCNQGTNAARNAAVKVAKGELIAFCAKASCSS